ncbi:hypothetical protein FRC04_007906 [Tulasnella sp. 424]|nr:hypothetical protein FRC04_007906 [Tulasnella sp. 424]KAG8975089.1 hypothetical protein FRC05_006512 [Tulasnella sp. 425]
MGVAVSKAHSDLLASGKEAKVAVKEQLEFLVCMANNRLDRYQSELEAMFLDKNSVRNRQVPGGRALRFYRGYRIAVTSEAASGIKDIVNAFFGVSEDGQSTGEDAKSRLVDGLSKTILTGLEAFLGNVSAGEQSEDKFFVFIQNNAVMRIDLRVWRYNFSNKEVFAEAENVLAYVFCLSVVDHRALTKDELLYLLTECGGGNDIDKSELTTLWQSLHNGSSNEDNGEE